MSENWENQREILSPNNHTVGSITNTYSSSPLTTKASPNPIRLSQNLAYPYKKAVNALSIDCKGKNIVLGGKKGLTIIDLDDPFEAPKTFIHQSKWEVGAVEWNPHPARSTFIASTANQDILIWNVADARVALQSTIQTQQRAVSDISWSLFDPNLLATCSADTYINLWDVRDPKKTSKKDSFSGWTTGATQVKWNRHSQNTLASAHNGEVRIWDIRKVSSPTTFITAHMAKIYGIDWSYENQFEIVTCSEDKLIKFWDINTPRTCKATLQAGAPVFKAKYTPFGLVTMAQRNDFSLRLWSSYDLSAPIRQYAGHTDIITTFEWRSRDNGGGAKEYQLVTWSKDQHLRFWNIDKDTQDSCKPGHISSPKNALDSKRESKNSLDDSGIHDLSHEFTMLEKKKSRNINIEEANLADRVLIAAITIPGKGNLRVKASMPALYPHGVAPLFTFLPSSFPVSNPSKLLEALFETAIFHVQNSHTCINQCLCQLVLLLKDGDGMGMDDPYGMESSPSMSQNSAISNANYSHELMTNMLLIPAPRMAGVSFSARGQIIYFSNLRYSGGSSLLKGSSNIPSTRYRTYRDLKNHLRHMSHSSQSNYGNHLANDQEPNSFSISNYFYSPQPTSKHDNSVRQPNHSILNQHINRSSISINTSVHIRDCSNLLPLNINLGKLYNVSGDIKSICANNKAIANQFGRKDLSQLWSLVSIITDPSVYQPMPAKQTSAERHSSTPSASDNFSIFNRNTIKQTDAVMPWVHHPMVRQTINSIFKHYERMGDLQTLAILSCVLEISPNQTKERDEEEPIPTSKTQPYVPITQSMSLMVSKPSSEFLPQFSASTTNLPVATLTTSASMSNLAIDRINRHASFGPPVVKKERKNEKNSSNFMPILDPRLRNTLDNYRQQYANVLYRWELLDKRAEILKFVKTVIPEIKSSIVFAIFCNKCNRPLNDTNVCGSCRIYGFSCAICHVAVRGITNCCMICGHGGHTKHMADWFSKHNRCPTGCGCDCLTLSEEKQSVSFAL